MRWSIDRLFISPVIVHQILDGHISEDVRSAWGLGGTWPPEQAGRGEWTRGRDPPVNKTDIMIGAVVRRVNPRRDPRFVRRSYICVLLNLSHCMMAVLRRGGVNGMSLDPVILLEFSHTTHPWRQHYQSLASGEPSELTRSHLH